MRTTDDQKELFIVVDRNDVIVDYRTREECHRNKNLIHRAINVALFNLKGEIAFQKRSQTKDLFPGFYALSVTGHVSKGESYMQAALREMKEEIGVENVSLERVSVDLLENATEKEMVVFFKGTYEGKLNPNKEEIDTMFYFDKQQVKAIKDRFTPCSLRSLQILGWL